MCFKNTERLLIYVTLIKFVVQHDPPPLSPNAFCIALYRNFMWEVSVQ